jgi:hypothetical protein
VQLNVKADIKRITRDLDAKQRKQIPFAAKNAINKTLFDVQRELKRQSPKKIDRPTPFTLRGFRVEKAKSKRDLHGRVIFNREYADILVNGGTQRPTGGRRTLATPTKFKKKNRYGNLSKTIINRIKADDSRFFFGVPKGRSGNSYNGVWERTNSNKRIRQVARFEQSRHRPKTFPFYKIAEGKAKGVFTRHFVEQLSRALRTAR